MDVGGFAVQVGKAALRRGALRVRVVTAVRFFGPNALATATAAMATAASEAPEVAHDTFQSLPGGAASLPLLLTPCTPGGSTDSLPVWLRPLKGRAGPGRGEGEEEQQERYCELCGLGAWLRGQGAVPGVHWVQLWRGAGGALRLRLCDGQPTALPGEEASAAEQQQQQQVRQQQRLEATLEGCSHAVEEPSVRAHAHAERPAAAVSGATVQEDAGEAAPATLCGSWGGTRKSAGVAEAHVLTAGLVNDDPACAAKLLRERAVAPAVAPQPQPLPNLSPVVALGGTPSPAPLHCATAASLDATPNVLAPPQHCPAPQVIAAPAQDTPGPWALPPPGPLAGMAPAAQTRGSAPARLQPAGLQTAAMSTSPSCEAPCRPRAHAGPVARRSSPDAPPNAADAAAVLAPAAGAATRPQGGLAAAASPDPAPSLPAPLQRGPFGVTTPAPQPSAPAAPQCRSAAPAPSVPRPACQAVPEPAPAAALPPGVSSSRALPKPRQGHVLDLPTVPSGLTPLQVGSGHAMAPVSQPRVAACAQPGLDTTAAVHVPGMPEPGELAALRLVPAPAAPCATGPSPLVTLLPGIETVAGTGPSIAAVTTLGGHAPSSMGDAAVGCALLPGPSQPPAAGLAVTAQGFSRDCLPARGSLHAVGCAGRASVLDLAWTRQQQQNHQQQVQLPLAMQADGLARQLQQLQRAQQRLQQEQQQLQARQRLLQQWQQALEVEHQAQLQQRLRQQLLQRQQELQWQRERERRRQLTLHSGQQQQQEQQERAWDERFATQQLPREPQAWPAAGGGAAAEAEARSGALAGDHPAGAHHHLPSAAAAPPRPFSHGKASTFGEAIMASAPPGGGPYSTGHYSPFAPLSGRSGQGGAPSLSPPAAAGDAVRCAQHTPQQQSKAFALARRLSSVTPPATPHSVLGLGQKPQHVAQRPQGSAGELPEPHPLPLHPAPSALYGEQPAIPQPQPVPSQPGSHSPTPQRHRPAAAGTDRPATQVAGTDRPATQVAGTDRPATQVAGTDRPATQEAGTDRPSTQVAGTDRPSTQVAGTDRPATQVAGTDRPSTQVAGTDRPATQVAGTDRPATQVAGTDRPATQVAGVAAGDTGDVLAAAAAAATVAPAPAAAAANAPLAVAPAEGPTVSRGEVHAAVVVASGQLQGPHALPAALTPGTARDQEALPLALGQARPRSPGLASAWSIDSAAIPAKRLRTGSMLPEVAATPLRTQQPSAYRDGGSARWPPLPGGAGGRHAAVLCAPSTSAPGYGPWRGGMEAPTCTPEPMRRAFSWVPQPSLHSVSPPAAVPTLGARLPATGFVLVLDEQVPVSQRAGAQQEHYRMHGMTVMQHHRLQRVLRQHEPPPRQQQGLEQQAGQPAAHPYIGSPGVAAPAAAGQQEDLKPEAPMLPAGLQAWLPLAVCV